MVKLGTVISQAKNIRCGEHNYPVLSMTMHDGLIFQDDKFKKVIASANRSEYKVVYRNQLVVSFPIDEGVLAAQRITDVGIVSPAYTIWDIDQAKILPEFLEYALRCDRSINYYKAKLRGSTARRRSLPTPTLLEHTIPLPAIDAQRYILEIIHKSRNVLETRKIQLQKLDMLVRARFVEMFGDPVLNEKGWKIVTVGDIVTEVRYGTSKPAVEGGKYPYLRMNNLTADGHLDLKDLKYIDISEDEIEKCVVRKGDVLFNRTNSIELVGKTAVFDLTEEMVIAGYIIRVRLNKEMLPVVFSQYMNLEPLKVILRGMAKGAVNQANINAQELQSIKVYIPDMKLQNQFADFVQQIDKSKDSVQKALDEAQLLFDSLMQQYFG